MVLNTEAMEAIKAKDKPALIEALKQAGYEDSAEYLAGKLLGEEGVNDGLPIL